MAIQLKHVLDGNVGQQELSTILQSARATILADVKAKSSSANLKALETRLNKIFYPVGVTAISTDYYNRRLATSTEEQLLTAFRNFNFETNRSGHYSAKTGMSPATLANSMKGAATAMKTLMTTISQVDSATDKELLESLSKQLDSLMAEGNRILENGERFLQFGQERIGGEDLQNAIRIVNQLMAFSKALSIPDFVTPQEAGILFEEALALTNYVDDASTDFINEELRKLATSTSQFGAQAINRGDVGTISYNVDAKLVGSAQEATAKGFKIIRGNATYTYSYNPSSARQGKMDVQLYYNSDVKDDYRVSAKRWSRGSGDLGETSIDAGISRAAGQSVAEAYKFAILTPNRDWANSEIPTYLAADAAHEFAKTALKSDIAMGLNQGKTAGGAGYANVLVIDTGSAIRVKDLAAIVEGNQALSKYNPSTIEASANGIYNSMSKILTGRTQSYLGLITSTLNKMKVTINLSVK